MSEGRLDKLSDSVVSLRERVTALEATVKNLVNLVNSLEADVSKVESLGPRLTTLEQQRAANGHKLTSLEYDLAVLQGERRGSSQTRRFVMDFARIMLQAVATAAAVVGLLVSLGKL